MKKLLFVLALLLFTSISSFSQEKSTKEYVYCDMICVLKPFSKNYSFVLDYGQYLRWFDETRMKNDSTGNLEKFNSMMDGLNYMARKGWELQQAYAVSEASRVVHHYIFRREN